MVASLASSFLGSTAMLCPAAKVTSSGGKLKSCGSAQMCMAGREENKQSVQGRREAMKLAAALVVGGGLAQLAAAGKAKAGLVEDLLAKSAANKELHDRKRLATSYANTARAYTVTFGTCKFPENFTGCQDLAKKKNVPFLTEDLKLECEGKEKYKCGSNVFWKW